MMKVDGLLKAKHRFFGKTVMHIVPAGHRLEIDELQDLEVAESLINTYSLNNN